MMRAKPILGAARMGCWNSDGFFKKYFVGGVPRIRALIRAVAEATCQDRWLWVHRQRGSKEQSTAPWHPSVLLPATRRAFFDGKKGKITERIG
jgi:hypothetical protein